MKIIATLTCLFIGISICLNGQTNELIISKNIHLPNDSTLSENLIHSLNGFLSQKDKPNIQNKYLLKEYLLETSALLDEIRDIEKSGKFNDDHFYKGYLNNLITLNDSTFLIQFSYIGIIEAAPLLRAIFTIIARKKENHFYFNSPLKQNTISWKNQKLGNTILYFKDHLNTAKAKSYLNTIKQFDKKLKAPIFPTVFFCCDNFHEALQLIGVDYKSDYNGSTHNTLTSNELNTNLIVNGSMTADFTQFDPHDLWHSRLHKVVSTSIINRPVDEGSAYLYGGSWGISWKDISEIFKTFAETHPNANWIELYNESKNFDEKGRYPLNVDFMINALFIQKIEKEKGFDAVIDLLSCGKKENDNENYFKALEKITGITKSGFNTMVWSLIKLL